MDQPSGQSQGHAAFFGIERPDPRGLGLGFAQPVAIGALAWRPNLHARAPDVLAVLQAGEVLFPEFAVTPAPGYVWGLDVVQLLFLSA